MVDGGGKSLEVIVAPKHSERLLREQCIVLNVQLYIKKLHKQGLYTPNLFTIIINLLRVITVREHIKPRYDTLKQVQGFARFKLHSCHIANTVTLLH